MRASHEFFSRGRSRERSPLFSSIVSLPPSPPEKIHKAERRRSLSEETKRILQPDSVMAAHLIVDKQRSIGAGSQGTVYHAQLHLKKTNGSISITSCLAKRLKNDDIESFKLHAFLTSNDISASTNTGLLNQIAVMPDYQNPETHYSVFQECELMLSDCVNAIISLKESDATCYQYVITQLLKDLLNGLKCLAEKNIVHRDIKECNIGIRFGNIPCATILDFDSAILTEKLKEAPTIIKGSPAYIPPEVFASNLSVPLSIDLYAIGQILKKLSNEPLSHVPNMLDKTNERHADLVIQAIIASKKNAYDTQQDQDQLIDFLAENLDQPVTFDSLFSAIKKSLCAPHPDQRATIERLTEAVNKLALLSTPSNTTYAKLNDFYTKILIEKSLGNSEDQQERKAKSGDSNPGPQAISHHKPAAFHHKKHLRSPSIEARERTNDPSSATPTLIIHKQNILGEGSHGKAYKATLLIPATDHDAAITIPCAAKRYNNPAELPSTLLQNKMELQDSLGDIGSEASGFLPEIARLQPCNDANTLYAVSPLCELVLSECITAFQQLDKNQITYQALTIFLLEAFIKQLERLEEKNCFEPDYKPENLALRNGSLVRIDTDGAMDEITFRSTHTDFKRSTPLYIPPELIVNAQNQDHTCTPTAAHIYMIGQIMLQIAGEPFADCPDQPEGLTQDQIAPFALYLHRGNRYQNADTARKLYSEFPSSFHHTLAALRDAMTQPLPSNRPDINGIKESVDTLKSFINIQRSAAELCVFEFFTKQVAEKTPKAHSPSKPEKCDSQILSTLETITHSTFGTMAYTTN